jgi:Domain of unknown function (DUF4377)
MPFHKLSSMKYLSNVMLRRSFIMLLVLACSSLFFGVSCKKEKNGPEELTMKIDATLDQGGPAPPATTDNPTVIYYMRATVQGTNEKFGLALGRIEGFEYEAGNEYLLKVLKTPIENPAADGHTATYKLIEIISKTKVDN